MAIHEVSVRSAVINGKLVYSSTFRLLAEVDAEGKKQWVKWTLPGIIECPEDAVRILRLPENAGKTFACSAPKKSGTCKTGQEWEASVKATAKGKEYADIIAKLCGVGDIVVNQAANPSIDNPTFSSEGRPTNSSKRDDIVVWLATRNVNFNPDASKADLLAIVATTPVS